MTSTLGNGLKPIKPRQRLNEGILKILAAIILSLILVFAVFHWAHYVAARYRFSSSRILRRIPGFRIGLRASRSYAARKTKGFPSMGHAILVLAYLLLNACLCLAKVEMARFNDQAARFGWVCAANITISVFLGMRNTPLGPLTSNTYNRLNTFHRVVGYTAIAQVLLHTFFYLLRFGYTKKRWDVLFRSPNLEGIISALGMLVLLFGLLRNRGYETFYISHILGSIVTILFAGLHRPVWRQKLPIIMIVAAVLWGTDRLIRLASTLWNLYDNEASVYALPNRGIRLVFKKPLKGFKPATHGFVWVPGIRAFQYHPFTVVSNTAAGVEMVFKARSGFTKNLANFAAMYPGRTVKASIEGPYGSLPNVDHYDRVILIAGGSGAAYTFGLTNSFLARLQPDSHQLMSFFWTVRNKEHLTWFANHLDQLNSHPSKITVALHVTGQSHTNIPYHDSTPGTSTPALIASGDFVPQIGGYGTVEPLQRLALAQQAGFSSWPSIDGQMQHQAADPTDLDSLFDIRYERLWVDEAIRGAVASAESHERVLVAVCGPAALMKDARAAAGRCMLGDGPSLHLHCENFDW